MSKIRIDGDSPAGAAANEILARVAKIPTRINMNPDDSIQLSWISEEHAISVNVDPGGRATCTEQFQDQVFARDVNFADDSDSFYRDFREFPVKDLAFGCPTTSWVGYSKRG